MWKDACGWIAYAICQQAKVMIVKMPKTLVEGLSSKKRRRIQRQVYELSCMAADEEIVFSFDEIKRETTVYDVQLRDQGVYLALGLYKMVIRQQDDMGVASDADQLRRNRQALRVVLEAGQDHESLLKEDLKGVIGM